MKRNILFSLACILTTFLYAQNGDKYFKDKDYARAQFAYEREVAASPALYLKLAKSYFALQKFDEAINALELYKTKYASAVDFKMPERKKISELGYTIILCMGDQQSDLSGGYCEKTVKLPNPVYFLP